MIESKHDHTHCRYCGQALGREVYIDTGYYKQDFFGETRIRQKEFDELLACKRCHTEYLSQYLGDRAEAERWLQDYRSHECQGCDRIVYAAHPYQRFCTRFCAKRNHAGRSEPAPINCEHCGNEFLPKRTDARFCSAKCRVAANRAKRKPGLIRFEIYQQTAQGGVVAAWESHPHPVAD